MSLNWLLIWTVTISCSFVLFSLLRSRIPVGRHYLPALLVGGTLLYSYGRDPTTAGYPAGVAWFVFLLLPGLAAQATSGLLGSRRFRSAYIMAWVAWFFHPYGGTRDQPMLVTALDLLNKGKDQEAFRILETLRFRSSAAGRAAFVILTRIQGNWQGLLSSIQSSSQSQKVLYDPLFLNIYLQALGETGQTELMMSEFERLVQRRRPASSPLMLNISRMKVAAFCGRTDLVVLLLDGPLGHFDSSTQRFWLATAMQASGRLEAANSIFDELLRDPDRQIAIAASRRLLLPVRLIHTVPENGNSSLLVEMETALHHEAVFALLNTPASTTPIATRGLALVLVIFFVCEMFNGDIGRIVWESNTISLSEKLQMLLANTTNNENLFEMGALVIPPEMFPDPHWRVFRAAFLHFGVLHLVMNILGLLIFGSRLEEAWEAFSTCLAYLVCAICSIYLMTLLPLGASAEAPYVLVGASGGVMGLIGCLLGYLGLGQMIRNNPLVAREFNLLFVIVMVQMIFDQNTPEVSSECHLLGLLIGVVLGLGIGFVKHHRTRHCVSGNQKLRTLASARLE